jgi:glycosyltransferase involved in cell wall biosynthesis
VAHSEFHVVVGKIHEKMNRLNLMLIIPEMSVGGAQRSLANLSLEFAAVMNVYLVVFNRGHSISYTHGGELISLDVYPGASWWSKFRAFGQRIRTLKRLKRQLKIDVSISFLEGADYVNLLSKQQDRVILSIRGSKVHDENMKGYFFFLRSKILIPMLYKCADAVVAVNHGIAAELQKNYKLDSADISVINNFYDFGEIERLSQQPKDQLSFLYNDKVIITVGRLAREKRLPFLISVFSKVKKEYHQRIRFILVGDGPQKKSLQVLCSQLNLRGDDIAQCNAASGVIFAGSQTNVFKYLNGSDIYVMNSSSEGFPNSLVEAMICGVPVMSSDCHYGPREIIAGIMDTDAQPIATPTVTPCGILMPLENTVHQEAQWVNMMIRLLNDDKTRSEMIHNARAKALAFEKKIAVRAWLDLILSRT